MDEVAVCQSPFQTAEEESSFSSMMDDYAERYFEVLESYDNLHIRLVECIEFMDKINIPFCYQYTKNSFKDVFDRLQMDIDDLGASLGCFPDTIRDVCYSIVQNADHITTKSNINYLDNCLTHYHLTVEYFLKEVNYNAEAGLECYKQSQLVQPNTCR